MNNKITSFLILCLFLVSSGILQAQSKVMTVYKSDKSTLEINVSEIDSITFSTSNILYPEYTPTFEHTNITEGSWDDFQICNGRLLSTCLSFYAPLNTGLIEYKDGVWHPIELPSYLDYLVVREYRGNLVVAGNNLIYAEPLTQEGGDGFHVAYGGVYDWTGALGGNDKNFFAGAGTNWDGILKYGGYWFGPTNQTTGSWFSIESLNDDEVFFGAGATHSTTSGNNGVMRWEQWDPAEDRGEGQIVPTNLTTGVFTLAKYNNSMFASGEGNIYRWNGNSFISCFSIGGNMSVAGDSFYLSSGNTVYIYDKTLQTFKEFYTVENEGFNTVAAYKGMVFLFGNNGIYAYNITKEEFSKVNTSLTGVRIAFGSDEYGLFASSNIGGIGIYQMIPVYE